MAHTVSIHRLNRHIYTDTHTHTHIYAYIHIPAISGAGGAGDTRGASRRDSSRPRMNRARALPAGRPPWLSPGCFVYILVNDQDSCMRSIHTHTHSEANTRKRNPSPHIAYQSSPSPPRAAPTQRRAAGAAASAATGAPIASSRASSRSGTSDVGRKCVVGFQF